MSERSEKCRLCLTSSENCSYIRNLSQLSKALKDLFSINIGESKVRDDFSEKCCPKCYKTVMSFYTFYLDVKNNQFKLLIALEKTQLEDSSTSLEEGKSGFSEVIIKSEALSDEEYLDEQFLYPADYDQNQEEVSDDDNKIEQKSSEKIESKPNIEQYLSIINVPKFEKNLEFKKGTKNRTCPTCSKTYHKPSLLKQHMLTHLPKESKEKYKRFECTACHKRFFTRAHLRRHAAGTHEKSHIATCSLCDKTFYDKGTIKKHIQTVHGEDNKAETRQKIARILGLRPFVCDICGKNFKRHQAVKQHIELVHLKFQHQCEHCLKYYHSKSTRDRHLRVVHLKTQIRKREVCNVCGKTYQNLRRHQEMIHNQSIDEKHVCEICGFPSKNKGALDTHKYKMHRPLFRCDICQKNFHEKIKLKSHIHAHHLIDPVPVYECKLCPFKANASNTMYKHMRECHYQEYAENQIKKEMIAYEMTQCETNVYGGILESSTIRTFVKIN